MITGPTSDALKHLVLGGRMTINVTGTNLSEKGASGNDPLGDSACFEPAATHTHNSLTPGG
jgi:hypothetical protein